AMTLATGLAMGGQRPFVAVYSTFLQRAFDQTVHDVCQNDQPVVIGVDRAGLVGEDGTSHQGMFTIPAQRQLPNLIVASPKDEQEARRLLRTAFSQEHPFALHYPRDAGFDLPAVEPTPIPVGEAELLQDGRDILIVGFGPIVMRGLEAAERLTHDGWSVAVINARYAKPLDRERITAAALGKRLVVTLEESVLPGGFGAGVLEALNEAAFSEPGLRQVPVKLIGLSGDRFVDHGSVHDLRRLTRLDSEGIAEQITEALAAAGVEVPPRAAPRAEVRSA
ncbi:MAG: 1-deoxy-D-xylulose-5-phosphate synthase, partial [Chloroflexi bacterium]|nr:1-deoxy-D-xylulose-5-phosphate synthase [Chloroflexota bacterium]